MGLEEVGFDDLAPLAVIIHVPEEDHLDLVMMLSLLHNLVQHPFIVIRVFDRFIKRFLTRLKRFITCDQEKVD